MSLIPPPPPLDSLPAGMKLHAGMGFSSVLADMDFETYSEAGFCWNDGLQKWEAPAGAKTKGLGVVGAAAYAEHASTEVLSFYYDLKDGAGRRFWRPGMLPPFDLFAYIAGGGLVEAWNVGFERWIWEKVCVPKYGWPPIPHRQYRCAMAKSRAYALPGALANAGAVLALTNQKDKDGDRLLKKFSVPRNPTAKDKRRRFLPTEDAEDGPKLYAYNERDIVTEAEASSRCPDLEGEELEFWLADQAINWRGVQIDIASVRNCIAVIDQAHARYNGELHALTGGAVARASEVQKLTGWLAQHGVYMDSLDEEAVGDALARPDLQPHARRALEIRQAVGSASVKKVYAMNLQATRAGRLHDLFSYHAARTGRATGNGPQPTNLPNSGPEVLRCGACERHFGVKHAVCPWCYIPQPPGKEPVEWGAPAAADALLVLASKSLDLVEYYYHDAMPVISGCLRGLFIAGPDRDLICADYSAIEAVVLAEVAGCDWRVEVFKTHGKIYEMSASKITGIPFEEFTRHKKETGQHHPMRKKVGKVAELASGYQGWVGAWKAFGADAFFTEDEMKKAILAWREASPEIVEFWGGQQRRGAGKTQLQMYGVEGMFVSAILAPGVTFNYRGFEFTYRGDVLYLRLLSGRYLTYHRPRLRPSDRGGQAISYEGWNTNPKNGPVGWIRMDTWGGRLTENIVQAVARDILRHAIVNLERAGYGVVLHVYDEIVAEVPKDWGSVEEFEKIMSTMPAWCAAWPVKAAGGWRGERYRKD